MEVSGQLRAPATLPPVPTGKEVGWATEPGIEPGYSIRSLPLNRLGYPYSSRRLPGRTEENYKNLNQNTSWMSVGIGTYDHPNIIPQL
jgi:hypothetical protein